MEIFHLLGLCPDSPSHLDLIDIVVTNYNQFQLIVHKLLEVCNMYK